MRVIIFDVFHKLREEELEKLSSLGIKEILTFDCWFEHEPVKGSYNFDRLLKYEEICSKLGIKLLIMGPIIPPLWVPKEWFLKNKSGMRNDFEEILSPEIKKYLNNINSPKKIIHFDFTQGAEIYWNSRFFSYWNPEAEAYMRAYIKKAQKILKHGEYICTIGYSGEYLFVSPSIFRLDNKYNTPWWYDDYAKKSWKQSKLTREDWLHKEFLRITRERLKLYKTKWLQYILASPENLKICKPEMTGNVAVEEAFEEHKKGLNTIRFCIFQNSQDPKIVAQMAEKYRIFAGAEGCKNIIPNSFKAEKMKLAGLICNVSLSFDYEPIKKWQYFVLKIVVSMDKKGIKGINARMLAQILRIYFN